MTDEMAGSDLDGDESVAILMDKFMFFRYTVIWDELLFIERNETPFDFTADPISDEDITEENLQLKMCDFYVSYMEQDSIGRIANAFINNSDQYGIHSQVRISKL